MVKPTLLVLAAGMGSRYGSLKQMDGVGPNNEAIIDYSVYDNKAVIIKGCSKKPVPTRAYILAAHHLQAFARSIMYGEACSAVPLYKSSKK